MKISPIVVKLRTDETTFGNLIAGSAELSLAISNTLLNEMAFVVQISEKAANNNNDNSISQLVDEIFAVVIALKNDTTQADKTGLTAHDRLFTVRSEIFSSILGWTIPGQESITSYSGGRLLDLNAAWLWYQFEFLTQKRLIDEDGFDTGAEALPNFDQLYTEYIMSPNANLPHTTGLPIDDTDKTQMIQNVDFTVNLNAGGFGRGFGSSFKVVKT